MTVLPWWRDKLMAFDTETSGVDVFGDRIVTAAIVQLRPGARPRTYTWIINPGIDIPTGASDIHGWTTERIAAAPNAMDPAQALFEIGANLAYPLLHQIPLVLFNAPFDLTMFEVECQRHGVPTLAERLDGRPIAPVLDPMVIDKELSRRRGKRRLLDVCGHYQVLHGGAHDAAADALAALRLVPVMVEKYGGTLTTSTPMQLHDLQVDWKADQAGSFTEYLLKKGQPADDVSPDWPLRRQPAFTQGAMT